MAGRLLSKLTRRLPLGPVALAVPVLALLIGAGTVQCGDDADLRARQIRDYIVNVATADGNTAGALIQGSPPAPSGGPEARADIGSATIITGSTTPATVSADVPFAEIIIGADGADNHYRLVLDSPADQVDLVLSIADQIDDNAVDFQFAVVDAQGQVSEYVTDGVTVTQVETGDLRITVAWDAPSDVDLRVTEPSGDVIDFNNRESDSGGALNFDSNTGCQIDGVNAESVSWPESAPTGEYTVFVDLFDDCGEAETRYVVTVNRSGAASQTFSGVYDAETAGNPELHTFAFSVGDAR